MNKDRAKIFSSFNPLSTLEKALKAQEREKSEKLDLDESNIEGLVSNVNLMDKSLTVVKTRVKFDDIYAVEVVS